MALGEELDAYEIALFIGFDDSGRGWPAGPADHGSQVLVHYSAGLFELERESRYDQGCFRGDSRLFLLGERYIRMARRRQRVGLRDSRGSAFVRRRRC